MRMSEKIQNAVLLLEQKQENEQASVPLLLSQEPTVWQNER